MNFRNLAVLLLIFCSNLAARVQLQSFCQNGGVQVLTNSFPSSNKFQQSYPGATVNVYYAAADGGAHGYATSSGTTLTWTSGTVFNANSGWVGLTITYNGNPFVIASVSSINSLTTTTSLGTNATPLAWSMPATAPAAIYSDNAGTAKANPYTCNTTTALQFIYADNGTYDFRFSGTGISAPFTISAVSGIDPLTVPLSVSSRSYIQAGRTFYQACLDAAMRGFTLAIDQTWYGISTSATCAAAIQGAGGLIQPANGQTVTLSQNTQCPLTQRCYDISLGGAIAFVRPPAAVSSVNFGADPTGVLDSGPAHNAATAAICGSGEGAKFVDVPGAYLMTTPWSFNNCFALDLSGTGQQANLIYNNASSAANLINMLGCFSCELHHFRMTTAAAGNAFLFIGYNTSSTLDSTQNYIHDNLMDSRIGATSVMANPIQVGGVYIDSNNDYHRFERNFIVGWTNCAALLLGGQSYSHQFRDNIFNGSEGLGGGPSGVCADIFGGSDVNGAASFEWHGGGIVTTTGCDFLLGDATYGYSTDSRIVIEGLDDETGFSSNSCFIKAYLGTHVIEARPGRWFATGSGPVTPIDVTGGQLLLSGILRGSDSGNTEMHIKFTCGGGSQINCLLKMHDLQLYTTDFSLQTLLSGDYFGGSTTSPELVNVTFTDTNLGTSGYLAESSYAIGTASVTVGSPTVTLSGAILPPASLGTASLPAFVCLGAASTDCTGSGGTSGGVNYPVSAIDVGSGTITMGDGNGPGSSPRNFAGLAGVCASGTCSGLAYRIGWNTNYAYFPSLNVGGSVMVGNGATSLNSDGSASFANGNVSISTSGSVNMANDLVVGLLNIGGLATLPQINWVGTFSGANNAITGTCLNCPALGPGLTIGGILGYSLQAGANTFNYSGGGAVAIKNQYGADLGTGYSASQAIQMIYNSTTSVWQIIGSN